MKECSKEFPVEQLKLCPAGTSGSQHRACAPELRESWGIYAPTPSVTAGELLLGGINSVACVGQSGILPGLGSWEAGWCALRGKDRGRG